MIKICNGPSTRWLSVMVQLDVPSCRGRSSVEEAMMARDGGQLPCCRLSGAHQRIVMRRHSGASSIGRINTAIVLDE